VGPLDKMGYQYISNKILKNNAYFLDHLYVISTTPQTSFLSFSSDKITFISNESTWNVFEEGGAEHFDVYKMSNLSYVTDLVRSSGFDFLINIHVNQYIDEINNKKLRKYAQSIFRKKSDFGFVWKAYQIEGELFSPDRRLPWLLNLHSKNSLTIIPDGIRVGAVTHMISTSDYFLYPYFIIDVDGLITEKDSLDRWDYYEKYLCLNNGEESPEWDYGKELLYRFNKWSLKVPLGSLENGFFRAVANSYSKNSSGVLWLSKEKITHLSPFFISKETLAKLLFRKIIFFIGRLKKILWYKFNF
jgi:hypothetical protein